MKNLLSSVKIEKLRADADINNGCVVAVGSFDGVHVGHRALLRQLASESERLSVPSAVFTFFDSDRPKMNIKQLAQYGAKPKLLADCGVDILVSAPFGLFRDMDAREFVDGFLYGFLGVKSVICGYDFRFGRDRVGDFGLIDGILSPRGVSVFTFDACAYGGVPVSSTLIRTLISDGEIRTANSLLGRAFSFRAPVCAGARLGRTLGFPTANQKYPSELVTLRHGVYAVRCILDGIVYGGVANFGVKPTVGGSDEPLCETYIFGFDGDCYGKELVIEFVDFIRDEVRFDSLDDLRLQVERDKEAALDIISKGENL